MVYQGKNMLVLRLGPKPLVYGVKIEEKHPDYEQKLRSGPKQIEKTTRKQFCDSTVTVLTGLCNNHYLIYL